MTRPLPIHAEGATDRTVAVLAGVDPVQKVEAKDTEAEAGMDVAEDTLSRGLAADLNHTGANTRMTRTDAGRIRTRAERIRKEGARRMKSQGHAQSLAAETRREVAVEAGESRTHHQYVVVRLRTGTDLIGRECC